jgi:tetratricopeptide (TPR) repeat protein
MIRWLGPPRANVDDATARRELPVTEVDRLHGEYRLMMLKSDWPFVRARQPVTVPAATNRIEEIAQAWVIGRLNWLGAMEEALAWYQQQGNTTEAARGEHYLRLAIALDGNRLEYRLSLAQSLYMQGRVRDAVVALEKTLELAPDDSRVKFWLGEMRREAAGLGEQELGTGRAVHP